MAATRQRWTSEQAWAWYRQRPVPYGFNFLPSSAINSTEMWQAESFDPTTIERELGWAGQCGFNSCRVFMQYLVWQDNPAALKDRLDAFLALAAPHGISTVLVLFDDCAFAGKEPHLGPQDDLVVGLHNGGWTPSPGPTIAADRAAWPRLEAYVRDLLGSFASDERILLWDLYNEPGNSGRGAQSRPLLAQTFAWARDVDPAQPLTSGVWGLASGEGERPTADDLCRDLSDVITFHHYDDAGALRRHVADLKRDGYPLICTEWMARTRGSLLATHLPIFAHERIGCYLWGLVNGRTQTHYPWRSQPGAPEPEPWFHDLFRPDGTPYDAGEMETIKRYSARFRAAMAAQDTS